MILTRELLQEAASKRGGWNAHQLKALGVDWPPKHGWIRHLIGTEISDDKWALVMRLRGPLRRAVRDDLVSTWQTREFGKLF